MLEGPEGNHGYTIRRLPATRPAIAANAVLLLYTVDVSTVKVRQPSSCKATTPSLVLSMATACRTHRFSLRRLPECCYTTVLSLCVCEYTHSVEARVTLFTVVHQGTASKPTQSTYHTVVSNSWIILSSRASYPLW